MFRDDRQRKRLHTEHRALYAQQIATCVDLWRIERDPTALAEAVKTAERSRARELIELLAQSELRPENAPADLTDEFLGLRDELRSAILRLRHEEEQAARAAPPNREEAGPSKNDPQPPGETRHVRQPLDLMRGVAERETSGESLTFLQNEIDRPQAACADRLARIRVTDPDYDPDLLIQPLDLLGVQAVVQKADQADEHAGGTVAVLYVLTPDRGLALLVDANSVEVVDLPEFRLSEAAELAIEWYGAYHATCRVSGKTPDLAGWSRAVTRILERVARGAVHPVVKALEQRSQGVCPRRLLISPTFVLPIFPLHAALLADGVTRFGDRFEVILTPSLSILGHVQRRPRLDDETMLSIDNPTRDLHFAEVESALARGRYQSSTALEGRRATRAAILEQSSNAGMWFYSGHCLFRFGGPLESALVLESDKDPGLWLTLRDIYTGLRLRPGALVILSGCESGGIQSGATDDYVGLPTGFLFAGARSVVGSLWVVDDFACCLITDRFLAEWRDAERPLSVAQALRAAQTWLRDGITSGVYLCDQVITAEFLARLPTDRLKRLCQLKAEALAQRHPTDPPFAEIAYWGAFVATGAAWE